MRRNRQSGLPAYTSWALRSLLCRPERSSLSSTFRLVTPRARSRQAPPRPTPGYDLVINLTFDFLSGTDAGGNPLHITNTAAVNLKRGAAFNPTTGAFINHASGGTSANIGDFDLPQGGVTEINGSSFSVDSMAVSGRSVEGFEFQIPGALVITSVPSPIPELGTWAMLFLGFAGLGCLARRRMREA